MDPITNNEEQALARLPEDSRNEVEDALVRWWAIRMQGLDAVAMQLFAERSIETAVGAQLDGLGAIVGEARGGRDDSSYRIRIRARILLNLSSGRADQILRILRLVTPLALTLTDETPGAVSIAVTGGAAELPEDLFAVALEAKAAGVRMFLRHQIGADAERFVFKGGVGKGFTNYLPDAIGPVVALDPSMEAGPPVLYTPDPNNPAASFVDDYQIIISVNDSYYGDPPSNTTWVVDFTVQLRPDWAPLGPYYFSQVRDYPPDYFTVSLLLPDSITPAGLGITFDMNYDDTVHGGLDIWGCSCTKAHTELGGRLVNVRAG